MQLGRYRYFLQQYDIKRSNNINNYGTIAGAGGKGGEAYISQGCYFFLLQLNQVWKAGRQARRLVLPSV
jgi:hypothetical protein